jgi:hypothetical protein
MQRVSQSVVARFSVLKDWVREVIDRVSKPRRRQQEKVVEFVSAFVTQYEENRQG